MHSKYIDEPWPLRLLVLGMLVASYIFIYRPVQEERDSLAVLIQTNNERSAIAEHALQNTHQYALWAAAVRRELGSVRTDMNENQELSFLLVDLDHAAHQRGVQLIGIDPQRAQSASSGLELIVHVRGHYDDIVHYLGDIVMTRILLRVSSMDLQRDIQTAEAGQIPTLDANIHVVLVKFFPTAQGG